MDLGVVEVDLEGASAGKWSVFMLGVVAHRDLVGRNLNLWEGLEEAFLAFVVDEAVF